MCGNLILHVKVFNGSIAEELCNNTCFVPEFRALVKVAAETGSCDKGIIPVHIGIVYRQHNQRKIEAVAAAEDLPGVENLVVHAAAVILLHAPCSIAHEVMSCENCA